MIDISKDIFLAILSLDAYNRGYGAGIGGLPSEEGTNIGPATILSTASLIDDLKDSAEAAGFQAIAYDTDYGIVISYRGTDFTPDLGFSSDVTSGWPIGGGNFFEAPALLAVDFLDQIQAGEPKSSVILTGHSLGGGLAGFGSRLFGAHGFCFCHRRARTSTPSRWLLETQAPPEKTRSPQPRCSHSTTPRCLRNLVRHRMQKPLQSCRI